MYRLMPRVKFALPPLLIVAVLFSLIRPAFAGDPKPLPQLKRRPPMNQSQADSQSFARSQLIKFVKEMPADEPVAIFEFGSGGILMLQDFTTDQTLLLEAAKKIKPQLSLVQYAPSNAGHSSLGGFYRPNMGAAL